MSSSSSQSSKLAFYSDWKTCDACGLPPRNDQKLKACTSCKSVAYHDANCQRGHWPQHKKECKKIAQAVKLLQNFMSCPRQWWILALEPQNRADCERIWRISVDRWRSEDYLRAMEGFQNALQLLQKWWEGIWKDGANASESENDATKLQPEDLAYAVQLARRLLFCAYCEADGGQLEACRQRLLQCISILLECSEESQTQQSISATTLDDAWMELMLSYEEVPALRRISRHVANMAITSGRSSCGWTDPLQRPGYMAKIDGDYPPYIPRAQHPSWCQALEDHWESIAKEMEFLEEAQSLSWGAVGSGDRGSGGDDHRVVSKGGKWTEYVLFGTGCMQSDKDAPITKRLLRQYAPDAVSLAEAGGGEVIFSRLAPKTHIEAHCGPTNLRWTAHLGLVVPPEERGKCQIRVGSEWYRWETGRFLLFDDSYEHEIINDTDETRTILLLRLWHPALSDEQRRHDLQEACRRKELAVEKRYHPPE